MVLRRAKSRHRERGTQLVEFALVLPFLLFMAMFVTEGAGFLRVHQVLNNAAREGARLSSLPQNKCMSETSNSTSPDPTCTDSQNDPNAGTIQNAVLYYLCANAVSNQNCPDSTNNTVAITISQEVPLVVSTETLWASTVTVSRPYNLPFMSSLPWFGVPPAITLTAAAQFQDFYGW